MAKLTDRRVVEWAVLIALVVLAAYTRLSHLDLVEFKNDEAMVSSLAAALADRQYLPLIGIQSSLHVNNPPIFVYLMAVPYLFTRDPALATGFVGLLGVLTVVGCYYLTRTYFGQAAAIIAGLLFAIGPAAVMYSRKIWAQDTLPFFTVLFMLALYAYVVKGRSWQLVLVCLWTALLPQVHFAGGLAIPILVLVLLLYRHSFRWLPFAAGVVVAGLTLIPFMAWQVAHDWNDLRLLLKVGQAPAQWDLSVGNYALDLVRSAAYSRNLGLSTTATMGWADTLAVTLLALGVAYAVYRLLQALRAHKPGESRPLALLLLCLGVPVAAFSRSSAMLHPYYLLTALPAAVMVVGIMLGDLYRFGRTRLASDRVAYRSLPWLKPATSGLSVLLVVVLMSGHFQAFTQFTDVLIRGSAGAGYGLPLRYPAAVVEAAQELSSPADVKPVYLAVGGFDLPSVYDFLARDRLKTISFDDQTAVVFPPDGRDQSIYIVTDDRSPAASLLQSTFPEQRQRTIAGPGGNGSASLYRLGPDAAARALASLPLSALSQKLANGVELLGWQAPRSVRAGDSLTLTLAWRIGQGQEPPGRDYVFFTHLVDSQRTRWGGVDALGYPSSHWQVGETVLSWQRLTTSADAPLGQYWLQLGMYDREGVRRVALTGPGGNAADAALLLGPLKVLPKGEQPTASEAMIQARQQAWLADQVQLLGYDLDTPALPAGGTVKLTLHWQAGAPAVDYTVLVHLVSETGQLVAQSDAQPRGGTYPTSLWDSGEYVPDEYQVALPARLAPGAYHLLVGMYDLKTGQRLPVMDSSGRTIGDAISLRSPVTIQP